ncbi:MAG: D-TA family PLP-dependent enzyme [Alphaproteobacteria bacterium]|nr:D-TA family PLP-dependent enzyme [Alphaproteobacteria bacterium]MBU0798747.1 D-TA family PLP-dependent enzyme [Alphaproteobacteria bacterium]MBU0886010.1 D-TA family PLP-dependent enzyme [Alphaproteobacteria bacterium]MBU1811999.1 D-TA family PLP-dependent enzyme [Alphaproteobacteria bacterium]MBU2091210.1 D-TA family PLP-dependent enzyme [Alphaproteobacteria bacterium]
MSIDALKREIALNFSTPAVVIDLDVVERNIARVQAMCDAAGVGNRPHIKTHKSPVLAAMQRAAGASGITCQKLGEAEVMADGGQDDIFISYNLLGEEKIGRLGKLLQRITIRVAADNPVVVAGLPAAAEIAGRTLDVLVECDTGRKRSGVETVAEAVALAKDIASRPGLNFAGFMLYPPEDAMAETQAFLDQATAGVREAGLDVGIVSSGGTPNLINLGKIKGATEHRAGTCIFNDRMTMACGAATLEDCAVTVYATVVSRAGAERGILDSGSKTLTNDKGGLDGFGMILEHPKARIEKFAEEHGFLDLAACNVRPGVGDVVRIVPNHVCVVSNMVDRFVTVRGDRLIGELPVAARGKLS